MSKARDWPAGWQMPGPRAEPTFANQGRSQYEANRGTCLSHFRFDPGSVLLKRNHRKDSE